MMNSLASAGVAWPDDSIGVGQADEGVAAYEGVGLEGSLEGGAMGRVNESRFAFREADDVDRDWRVGEVSLPEGVGGGGMTAESTRPPACSLESAGMSSVGLLDKVSEADVEAKTVVVAAELAIEGSRG